MNRKEWLIMLAGIITMTLLFTSLTTFAARGILCYWDKNPEPDILHYNIYVGTNSRTYHLTYSIPGHKTKVAFYYDWMSESNRINFTNTFLPSAAVYPLPYTNHAVYYMAATAVNTLHMESDFSDEVSITNRPAPPGLRFIEVNLAFAEIGFTNLPPKFQVNWSNDLISWKDLMRVSLYDHEALPWNLRFYIYATNSDTSQRFYRLSDLSIAQLADPDLLPALPDPLYFEGSSKPSDQLSEPQPYQYTSLSEFGLSDALGPHSEVYVPGYKNWSSILHEPLR